MRRIRSSCGSALLNNRFGPTIGCRGCAGPGMLSGRMKSLRGGPASLTLVSFGGSIQYCTAMWPSDEFGVVLWTSRDGQLVHLAGQSAAAVRELVAAPGPLVLDVSAGTPILSLSDFLLWRNADGVACVRIDQHREHYGIDPTRSAETGEIWFRDEQDGSFPVQTAEVIEMWQAAAALGYWLRRWRHVAGTHLELATLRYSRRPRRRTGRCT